MITPQFTPCQFTATQADRFAVSMNLCQQAAHWTLYSCKRAPFCHERPKTQDIFYTVVMTLCPRRRNWSKMKRRKLRNKILLLLLRYETATAACIQQTLDVRTDSYFSLILQLKRFLWVLWGYYAVLITIEATRPQTKAYCHKPYTPRNHHLTDRWTEYGRKEGQTNKTA